MDIGRLSIAHCVRSEAKMNKTNLELLATVLDDENFMPNTDHLILLERMLGTNRGRFRPFSVSVRDGIRNEVESQNVEINKFAASIFAAQLSDLEKYELLVDQRKKMSSPFIMYHVLGFLK